MNVDRIIGAERVIERFGEWPSFHDAEVVRVTLDRRGPSAAVLVHTWLMTEQVDEKGYYVLERHTLVQLIFDQLTSCELSDFNHQNVLYSLNIAAEAVDGPASFGVTLDSSFGLSGTIICGRVIVADVIPCNERGEAMTNPQA